MGLEKLQGLNSLEYQEQISDSVHELTHNEWQKERLGRFTSSRLGDLMTSGRGKDKFWGDTAMRYIYEKIGELLSGVPHYTPETRAMEWGTEHEAEALEKFADLTGLEVTHLGTTFVPFNDNCGGSPDAYVGDNAIAEVKCPYVSANHIKTYIERELPKAHMFQCQGNMLFTGKELCHYISYDPRMPEAMQLVIIPVERDEEICKAILERIEKATAEIIAIEERTGIKLNVQF